MFYFHLRPEEFYTIQRKSRRFLKALNIIHPNKKALQKKGMKLKEKAGNHHAPDETKQG
jgi:hypothetical protein